MVEFLVLHLLLKLVRSGVFQNHSGNTHLELLSDVGLLAPDIFNNVTRIDVVKFFVPSRQLLVQHFICVDAGHSESLLVVALGSCTRNFFINIDSWFGFRSNI